MHVMAVLKLMYVNYICYGSIKYNVYVNYIVHIMAILNIISCLLQSDFCCYIHLMQLNLIVEGPVKQLLIIILKSLPFICVSDVTLFLPNFFTSCVVFYKSSSTRQWNTLPI